MSLGIRLLVAMSLLLSALEGQQPQQDAQRAQSAQPLTALTGNGQTVQVDAASTINAANIRRFHQTHIMAHGPGIEAHEMHDVPYDVPGVFAVGQGIGYGEMLRCVQNATTAKGVGRYYCNALLNLGDQTGMSLGNLGGWMTSSLLHLTNFTSYAGISQVVTIDHMHSGVGDSSMVYGYPLCAGGTTAGSDEGCAHWSSVGGQYSQYFSGKFMQGTITGQTVFPDFDAKNGICYNPASQGNRYCYGQGEYLIDSSAPIAQGALLSATVESGNAPALLAVEPANLTPVPTWGYIPAPPDIPKVSTANVPKPTGNLTVTIVRGAGFQAGDAVCFMGSVFPENSTVLSATPLAGGTQTITLSLRKPEKNGVTHFIYKTPACGQLSPIAEEQQTGWPAGYFAVPVDAGHLAWAFYSHGSRQEVAPPFDVKGRVAESPFVLPVQERGVILKRAPDGTVVATGRGGGVELHDFAHYPRVSVSGCQDASFNEMIGNPIASTDVSSLTYQSATKSAGTCNSAVLNIVGTNAYALYYGAEIISTSNPDAPGAGASGYIEVEQNRIPWQPGHLAKVGHVESFNGSALRLYQTQLTPGNGFTGSGSILHAGVSGMASGCAICLENFVPANHYSGLGGWQRLPDFLFWKGPIGRMLDSQFAPRTILYAGHSIEYPQGSPNEPDYQVAYLRGYKGDGAITASPSAFGSPTAPSWTFTGASRFVGSVISNNSFFLDSGHNTGWTMQLGQGGRSWSLHDVARNSDVMTVESNGKISFSEPVTAPNLQAALEGATSPIGGTSLTAGMCATGNASVPGAVPGQPVAVSATDGSLPQPMILLSAAVVAADTVKVQLCAVTAMTPPAKAYNVRVIP
ncbi:hypothetical protein [Terriglobus albidus]|uniref:hypothetical protein n=1 Tax=Terriglobus albidus TaxID=1592106 RepID=UPI0021E02E60|nr:hypothetical protein [Terriglobus albidus]